MRDFHFQTESCCDKFFVNVGYGSTMVEMDTISGVHSSKQVNWSVPLVTLVWDTDGTILKGGNFSGTVMYNDP